MLRLTLDTVESIPDAYYIYIYIYIFRTFLLDFPNKPSNVILPRASYMPVHPIPL